MKHKIMIKDHKMPDKEQEIKFSWHSVVILGDNLLDWTHRVNYHLSRKENDSKKKVERKVTKQG